MLWKVCKTFKLLSHLSSCLLVSWSYPDLLIIHTGNSNIRIPITLEMFTYPNVNIFGKWGLPSKLNLGKVKETRMLHYSAFIGALTLAWLGQWETGFVCLNGFNAAHKPISAIGQLTPKCNVIEAITHLLPNKRTLCVINTNTTRLPEAMACIVTTTSWMRGLQRFWYSEGKIESVKMRNRSVLRTLCCSAQVRFCKLPLRRSVLVWRYLEV